MLILKSGGEFGFDKLIVATGARPRVLTIPGAHLRNLYYLRTMHDSKIIRSASKKVKRAVVIGGGCIGMEVAAVLAQKEIEVTMVLISWVNDFRSSTCRISQIVAAGKLEDASQSIATALERTS